MYDGKSGEFDVFVGAHDTWDNVSEGGFKIAAAGERQEERWSLVAAI